MAGAAITFFSRRHSQFHRSKFKRLPARSATRSANSKPRTAPAPEVPLSQIPPGEKRLPSPRKLKTTPAIAIAAATLAFALAGSADEIALKGYSLDGAKHEMAIEKQYRSLASP